MAHQAFVYESPEDFVVSMAPFVREGIARGDRVLGATKPANVKALREELGDDAALVELHATGDWCAHPYERLQEVRRLVGEAAEGNLVRTIEEPIWDGSEATRRQWARYESIINLALADAPLRFVCVYDGAALPDEILECAARTHPERVEHGSVVPCEHYVPPEEFEPPLGSAPPTPSPTDVHELAIDADQQAFRTGVARIALELGMRAQRVEELVLAANEVATNALRYGRPPAAARCWRENGELVCEIADAGPGIADPLAGWILPDPPARSGWGLPMTRQLCDAVDISTTDGRTTVSLHLALNGG